MNTHSNGKRLIRGADGLMYDAEMHPKVLKAQEEADRKARGVKKTTTGFTYPSKLETELRKKEEEA